MFMSKDAFDDGPRVSTLVPPSRQQSSSQSSLTHHGSISSNTQSMNNQSINNQSSYDDSTPAMRKAKMDEVLANQLGKRKGRMLVPTTMSRQDRPMSANGSFMTSSLNQSINQSSINQSNNNSFISTSRPMTASNNLMNSNNQSRPASSSYSNYQKTAFAQDGEETKRESESTYQSTNQSINQSNASNYQSYQGKKASEQMIGASPVFDPTNSNTQSIHQKDRSAASSPTSDKHNRANQSINQSINQQVSQPNNVQTPLSIASLSPLALRLFLSSPTPPGQFHQCYIVRNKKGISNRLYPHYECIYENGEKFLMIAKKRSKNKTSNYLISCDREKTEKGDEEFLGKIRSNFVGTEFSIYDDGQSPDAKQEGLRRPKRAELGVVLYESNILGSKGPRKMTVIAPSVKSSKEGKYSPSVHRPLSAEPNDSLLAAYQTGVNPGNFVALVNKTPKWNDQVGAYVLNFNGRVTMASVKNFQLMIHKDESNESSEDGTNEDERPALQFGRVGKDTFTMDFGFPLSPLQAFAICLSSFDSKLACE